MAVATTSPLLDFSQDLFGMLADQRRPPDRLRYRSSGERQTWIGEGPAQLGMFDLDRVSP
jgi:hypothetical protein